jgi:RHS repeat-associated protein
VLDRTTGAVVAELRYDALSRVATGATDGEDFERWFAGSTRIHEIAGVAGVTRQHSPHPLWPVPYAVADPAGPAYVHQDEGWSTMCVTDAAGAVLERHRYEVFGAGTAFAADGVTPLASLRTEARWRGMIALGTTSLFYTPERLYDPEIGVFTGRDRLLYLDGPSAFAYAAQNPVDFAVPSGLAKSPLGNAVVNGFGSSAPAFQQVQETVITAEPPFNRAVSDSTTLAAAEGRGHIEAGDAWQFLKGAYNGVVNSFPVLAGPIVGPFVEGADIPKASIDPRFGGAGIIGEQLFENLAIEAATLVPSAVKLTKRVLASRTLANVVKAPVFWMMGAGGPGGGMGAVVSAGGGRAAIPVGNLGAIGAATSKRSFRWLLISIIKEKSHPLHGLLNAQGKLTSSTARGTNELVWFENPNIIEAGHYASAKGPSGCAGPAGRDVGLREPAPQSHARASLHRRPDAGIGDGSVDRQRAGGLPNRSRARQDWRTRRRRLRQCGGRHLLMPLNLSEANKVVPSTA